MRRGDRCPSKFEFRRFCAVPLGGTPGSPPKVRRWARSSTPAVRQYPALAPQVLSDNGSLHRFVNVYVNDDDVRYLERLETKVAPSDIVSILPAVAGGSARARGGRGDGRSQHPRFDRQYADRRGFGAEPDPRGGSSSSSKVSIRVGP